MRHGDEIQVLLDGPSIRLNALLPIGIAHDSQCWGVWIDQRHRQGETLNPEDPRDFVISPIHPDHWPFVFRVEASMRAQAGTLHSLSRELESSGVNVLFLDHAPGGYSHSVFNSICMFEHNEELNTIFLALQEAALKILVKDPVDKLALNQKRLLYFERLGKVMIVQLAALWAKLRIEEGKLYDDEQEKLKQKHGAPPQQQPPRLSFLASRVVEQGLEPWFLRLLDADDDLILLGPNQPEALINLAGANKEQILKLMKCAFCGDKTQTLSSLLDELRDRHKRTTYATEEEPAKLTVQATLAHMDTDKWRSHILRRFTWRHVHLPLAIQALVRLAEMRFWMEPYDPVEFIYDADRRLLKPLRPERFAEQVKQLGKCGPLSAYTPTWALASYNHEDRFVRLRFLPEATGRTYARVEIVYEVPGIPTPDINFARAVQRDDRSKGMLKDVTGVIASEGGNILRASNTIGSYDPHTGSEKGKLRFSIEFDSHVWSHANQETFRETLGHAVNNVLNRGCNAELIPNGGGSVGGPAKYRVNIIRFQRERMFVSTILSHRRSEDFRRILSKVAQKQGIEVRYALTNTGGVRLNIDEEIESCRYFLQIVTPREEEQDAMRTDPQFIPDFSWITYEHGFARALQQIDPRRRSVQMIDQLMSPAARDRLRSTGGDIAPIRFRVDDSEKMLRRAFANAIAALLQDKS